MILILNYIKALGYNFTQLIELLLFNLYSNVRSYRNPKSYKTEQNCANRIQRILPLGGSYCLITCLINHLKSYICEVFCNYMLSH